MKIIVSDIFRRVKSDSGAQFMEYALLVGLIAVGVAVAVGIFSGALSDLFQGIADWIKEDVLPGIGG